MEAEIIQKNWLSLADKLLLKPDSIQYVEMRRAFFAGAYTVVSFVKIASEYDAETGADMLESVWQECESFRMIITHDPELN